MMLKTPFATLNGTPIQARHGVGLIFSGQALTSAPP